MSLTWHIVKKDLRALQWPLLVWILLIVSKLGVGVVLLNARGDEGIEWFMKLDILARVLGGFEFVSFVLTAALVQEDLMVGTTAFWMTRPISGARLLRAKLLGLGLCFGVLPVLVTLPWWLGCGYDASQIAWAITETVAVQGIAVLLALMWSAISDGYGRFLMWTLVTVFAVPTLAGSIVYWISRLQHTKGPPEGVLVSRGILGYALAAAGILVVFTHQYLTRNTRRSIALLASIAGLIVLVGIAWPWNLDIDGRFYAWINERSVGEWPKAADPGGLKYSVVSAAVTQPAPRNGSIGRLHLKYRVEGLAGTQALMPYGGRLMLRWPDGKTEPVHAQGWSGEAEMFGSKMRDAALRPPGGEPYAETVMNNIGLNPWVAGRFKTEAPAATLSARVRLMQFESATSVPLAKGAHRAAGTKHERIVNVEKFGEELYVVFIRMYPSLLVDTMGGGPLAPGESFTQYFLVNKARNFADSGRADFLDRGRALDYRLTRIATVGVSWQTMAFRASAKGGGRRPLLEAIQALDTAELVKVTFKEQARFSHEVTADPLKAELTGP